VSAAARAAAAIGIMGCIGRVGETWTGGARDGRTPDL
jgi:hypothetical protein